MIATRIKKLYGRRNDLGKTKDPKENKEYAGKNGHSPSDEESIGSVQKGGAIEYIIKLFDYGKERNRANSKENLGG